MYNTNNGNIVYGSLSSPTFTNGIVFGTGDPVLSIDEMGIYLESSNTNSGASLINFIGDGSDRMARNTRANLGLGATNDVVFSKVSASTIRANATTLTIQSGTTNAALEFDDNNIIFTGDTFELRTPISFGGTNAILFAAATRTNLGLGATNIVTFAGLNNNGDITINQTTATNGLLYVYRTNAEPFLGLANLIASNNTTLSNETLFRVGRAEATNQSAQFGFRVVRTNNGGEGLATFSVFGYNALMMIGPSDRSRTNTATNAGIEADIWTINQTNRVMTLRDTNTGALTMHQDLGFGAGLTNTAPTNTNTPAVWIRVWVGTNNYRLPLYQ